MKNKRFTMLLAVVALLLCIPLIAMQFTNEVDWNILDFIVMGFLMVTLVSVCELVLRKVKSLPGRVLVCGTVLFAFFMIWAELAVGVFGTPFAGS